MPPSGGSPAAATVPQIASAGPAATPATSAAADFALAAPGDKHDLSSIPYEDGAQVYMHYNTLWTVAKAT